MKKLEKLGLALLPYLISILVLLYICSAKIANINNLKDIITSTINFITVIVGFLSTMLSILIASSDKSIMKYLKHKEKINTLYRYILVPILIGFIDIMNSLIFLPYCEIKPIYSLRTFKLFIVFTILFTIMAARSILILVVLVIEFNKDTDVDCDDSTQSTREIDFSNAFKNKEDN